MDDLSGRQRGARFPCSEPMLLPTVLLLGRCVFLDRVSAILHGAGFPVERAWSEDEARGVLACGSIGLLVIDGGLSTPTDFSACSRLAQRARCPVVMMAAGNDDCDRILALELGADDCMSATWGPAEFLARVRALLRRGRQIEPTIWSDPGVTRSFGEWRLDLEARRVLCPDGRWMRLGSLEATILQCLARNSERTTPSREIIDAGASAGTHLTENHLRVQICRLRTKLGRDSQGRMAIFSVRSKGYALTRDRPGTAPGPSPALAIAPRRPPPLEVAEG